MQPIDKSYQLILTPPQLKWAMSVSTQLKIYAIECNPLINQFITIEVPKWVTLTPSKVGTLIASMAGATVDMDIMEQIQIMELLRFHMWMEGNNYLSAWASISISGGDRLLAELINIFGLFHPATFEVAVWKAKEFKCTYATLLEVMLRRSQDVVDADGISWDIVIAMLKDKKELQC